MFDTQGIAEKFLMEGAYVVILDYREDVLADTVKYLKQKTLNVHVDAVVCDLNQPDQIETAAERSWQWYEGLDILVNDAGIAVRESFTDIPFAQWQDTMNVNLNA